MLAAELGSRDDAIRKLSTLEMSLSHRETTIKGGESTGRALRNLIKTLAHDRLDTKNETKFDSKCPICQDEIVSPVQLACGHSYCAVCIQHFLTTASNTKVFPLSCMGDDNNCRIPISIPTLQRLLSPQEFKHLLETAFVAHIERFPREFRHCPTPGCSQVYRCNRSLSSSVLHCPSCLAAVCSTCHKAHEGTIWKACTPHSDATEQERLNNKLAIKLGFKKCPECRIWIEKMGGCDHVYCRCGAHICWVCVHAFAAAAIYKHTTTCTARNRTEDYNGVQAQMLREGLGEVGPRPRRGRSCVIM